MNKRVLALGLLVPGAVVLFALVLNDDWFAPRERRNAGLAPAGDSSASAALGAEQREGLPKSAVARSSIASSDEPVRTSTECDREALLAVPDDYPFDPTAPLPKMLRLGEATSAALAEAMRGNQLGVNPIKATIQDADVVQLHQWLTPALEERKLLVEELVTCQGEAMDHSKPIAGRVFDSEGEAEAFARKLFGGEKGGSLRIWGTRVYDGGRCSVFLVDPFKHGAAYHAHANLCNLDEMIAMRMREFVLTR